MPNLLFSISALLFYALSPVSLQAHKQDGSSNHLNESQSSRLSQNKLQAEDSQSQSSQAHLVEHQTSGQSLEESVDRKRKRGLLHQNGVEFKNSTGSWEVAPRTLTLNKLKNDSLEFTAGTTIDFPKNPEWKNAELSTTNSTLTKGPWPFPPKIENPLFSSGSSNFYYSTEIARRLLQTTDITTQNSNSSSSTMNFVASGGKKPKINPNSTTEANQTDTSNSTNSTESTNTTNGENSTNSTNQTQGNSTINQTATNDTNGSATNSTTQSETQANQTATSNSTSSNQTTNTNGSSNTGDSINSTGSANTTQSSNSSNVTNDTQPSNSTTNTSSNTTTNSTSNTTTNTSTSGSGSIIIKPPSNNYQVNGNPTTPSTSGTSSSQTNSNPASSSNTQSSSTSSSTTPTSSPTNTGSTTTPTTTSGSSSTNIDMRDSTTGQQTTTSSQITTATDGSSPTINIEKRGQIYEFSVSNYNQNVANPSSQKEVDLSLNAASGDLTDFVTFSSPLTAFKIPADTHLITLDFGASSNCALPLFFASNSKSPIVTLTGTTESPAFKVETDFTQSAGFFYNTIKSTSETYSYTSSISQARSSDFKSQTIAIINPIRKQAAYGIVYCPYFVSQSNSFSGSVQITTQPKNITESVWPSNSTQDLSSMVHSFYVPYGGNYTMDFTSIPSELKFSFNSSNTELVFNVEYEANTAGIDQLSKQINAGQNVEFIVPKGSSLKIKIVNLSLENGVVLALTVSPPEESTGLTIYIIIGIVVGVAIIAGLIVLFFWMRRRKRLQEIIRLNKQERLLSDPESPPDIRYPILSGLNPNSHTNLSDEEEKKNGMGPLLSDEQPDSQKVLPHMFSTDNLPGMPEHRIEIYTLNIDEFSNPEVNDNADNIILETKDRSTK